MTQQEFLSRRQALLAQMQPGSAALIFAAPEAVRSRRFRISLPAEQRFFGTSPASMSLKPCWC
ncbi:Xaa-Pro aminopeptidase [Raoultella terrigena]|uniref:Xaa-Pro aminopeptidase n=1 Tax=Raoultella terrigena TaxID=577 RepID=A0A3P8M0A5_RAOTE|nr:Xaa-Pro aminopeptidase [Raoultella terrigena]